MSSQVRLIIILRRIYLNIFIGCRLSEKGNTDDNKLSNSTGTLLKWFALDQPTIMILAGLSDYYFGPLLFDDPQPIPAVPPIHPHWDSMTMTLLESVQRHLREFAQFTLCRIRWVSDYRKLKLLLVLS